MSLLDFLRGETKCDVCGSSGAKKGEWGRMLCPNPSCPNFDLSLSQSAPSPPSLSTGSAAGAGQFSPARPVTIRYSNFQHQEKVFTADAASAIRKKNHIVVRVAPTGQRITLSRDRIQNLIEVENAIPQRVAPGQELPTPRERQVLGYHKKHGTTSPLYEKVRKKYPNW